MDIPQKENQEDFEDGELPEDGEICDDEDDVAKPAPSKPMDQPAPAPEHQKQQPAAGVNGPAGRDSKEKGDRNRRFERNSPPKRDPDPFGPHSDAPEGNDYFGANGGDKDYRGVGGPAGAEEEPFSDTDYRVNRRRRHSPLNDDGDYDGRSKRSFFGRGAFRGGAGGGFRNGPKPRFQTEHQICKFFREGYCRDGDNCSYSHQAEDSLRRPVLCNFYANSYCKKGLQCLMLHGEFPCKDFHKGHCNHDQCRFSHVPLTEYTRPIVDKLLAIDEERQSHQPATYRQNPVANAAAAAAAANVSRRRVLLPGGPNGNQSSPPHAPVIHAPVPQPAHHSGGQLPPPAVVVPIRNSLPPMYPPVGSAGYFNTGPRPEQVQGLPPPRTIEPPRLSTHAPIPHQQPMRPMHPHGHQMPHHHLQQPGLPPPQQVIPERRAPSPPTFNLEAMLNKLANGDKTSDRQKDSSKLVDDSPASPPPFPMLRNQGSRVTMIPQDTPVTWALIRVPKRLPYSNVENVDKIPANDPRKARAIAKQFDAFSSFLGSGGSGVSDPRLRAQREKAVESVRPQNTMPFSSWMPQIS
ncbi:unnamed protein product [Caenorhabditis sp. 36 PRJEB53466]|nr:unnamed protein product [Caenorhabditis sp. 36 PRJEB53466]